jgi:hypothetical protein
MEHVIPLLEELPRPGIDARAGGRSIGHGSRRSAEQGCVWYVRQ